MSRATTSSARGAGSRFVSILMLFAASMSMFAAVEAGELDMQITDDFGPSEFGAAAGQCNVGVCLDVLAPFTDSNGNGAADPLAGSGNRDWGSTGWSIGLCCSSHQRLEITQAANNGPAGDSDCRDTPVEDVQSVGCKAGGDVSIGKSFNVNSLGQSYAAVATVKLVDVHQPQPGMFRARLTIHGYDASGRLQQECNAFLRSTEVDGPDGNPLPGTADQTAAFIPIEIPECEMVDSGSANGVGNVIDTVDVAIRANNFKNDIAYGAVRLERLVFVRLS